MSPEDLKDLAHGYRELADAFVSWRGAHHIADPTLSDQFDRMVADLTGKSNRLERQSVTTALQDLQTSLTDLHEATRQAKNALTTVKDLTKALAIGGAAVSVVASLMAPAVAADTVADALNGLVQTVKTATASDGHNGDGEGSAG